MKAQSQGTGGPRSRRTFLKESAAASVGAAALAAGGFPAIRAAGAGQRLKVGVMGLSRGLSHVQTLLGLPEAVVGYVCDVDEERLAKGVATVREKQKEPVAGVSDFRRILEDPEVDALFIAAPNHWHAPATILACSAGKHVYVEKPASHNPREGEWMVAAARRHDRRVQMGNQRRSFPGIIRGMEAVRAGEIGEVRVARCWYTATRGSIGKRQPSTPPSNLHYDLWQGPAPERPYRDNVVHYNWHWHWHWGNGEIGNNGVHALDLARWGLGVDHPVRVGYVGNRYHFDDDQETPDTGTATFDFGHCQATWEGTSCDPRKGEDLPIARFYGTKGRLTITGSGFVIVDMDGREVRRHEEPRSDAQHFRNFLNAIRDGETLNAEIEDAQRSTLLCHLANISLWTGRTLEVDPATGRPTNIPDLDRHWGREYREGWRPVV